MLTSRCRHGDGKKSWYHRMNCSSQPADADHGAAANARSTAPAGFAEGTGQRRPRRAQGCDRTYDHQRSRRSAEMSEPGFLQPLQLQRRWPWSPSRRFETLWCSDRHLYQGSLTPRAVTNPPGAIEEEVRRMEHRPGRRCASPKRARRAPRARIQGPLPRKMRLA